MKQNKIFLRAGTTRSGKMIPYTLIWDEIPTVMLRFKTERFLKDDFLDVFAVFEFLALRSKRRSSDLEAILKEHGGEVLTMMTQHDFESAKTRANISSAFQLRDLGQSLAAIEFIDL